MQNGYIESFDGRFRDECLNEHRFQTLHEARKEIAVWRLDYNELRPHGSIGRVPPARFVEQHRRHAGNAAQQLTPTNNEIQQSSTRTPAETLVWQMGAGQPIGLRLACWSCRLFRKHRVYPLDPKKLQTSALLRWSGVAPNVYFLGITSMLTDISSEMVTSVLPVYLMFAIGLTPLQFGLIDGLSQGTAALARVFGGVVADRWARNRDVAAMGYGLSAVCKLMMLAAGSAFGQVVSAIALDRVGKGIRTSPRDALISLSTAPERLGLAFGVHRALDTLGALIGPLVAFGILAVLPRAFDLVFVTSFFVALCGLATLLCLVREVPVAGASTATSSAPTWHAIALLLRHPQILSITLLGAALGLFTAADSFVFLMLQRKLSAQTAWFPLFYVATALAYLALAIPAGRLGDRFGRTRVFLMGHLLLVLAWLLLLFGGTSLGVGVSVLSLLGTYYACTDGVLMAMASRFVPASCRASGLGIVATANGVARLLASLLFGALWEARSLDFAFGVFTAALAATLLLAGVVLRRLRPRS